METRAHCKEDEDGEYTVKRVETGGTLKGGCRRGYAVRRVEIGNTLFRDIENDKLRIVTLVLSMFLLGLYSTGNVMVGPPHVKDRSVPQPKKVGK